MCHLKMKTQRTDQIGVPVTAEEKARLRRAAGNANCSIAQFVRGVLRPHIQAQENFAGTPQPEKGAQG